MKSAVSVLSISALLLSGCSSILNPYVSVPVEEKAFLSKGTDKMPYAGNMTPAIEYAVSLHNAYNSAIGGRARFRNGLAMTLIPLTAAGVFVGLTGNSRRSTDALTAIAVGGTGAYALGSYYDNVPLERVYINGMVTTFCAISAMRPYLVSQAKFGTFEQNIDKIGGQISAVELAVIDLGDVKGDAGAQALVRHAKAAVTQARQIQIKGNQLQGKIGAAGVTLMNAMASIEGQVNMQVATLQPNLATLMTSIQGLQGGAGRLLASLAPISPAPGDGAKIEETMEMSLRPVVTEGPTDKLKTALTDLAITSNAIANEVNALNGRIKSTQTLSSCQVAQVANVLSVSPAETEITLKNGAKMVFSVSGGVGQPSASVVGSNADAIGVTGPTISGNAVQFEVTADATATGTPQLVFTDGSGSATHRVDVTVEKAEAPAPQ